MEDAGVPSGQRRGELPGQIVVGLFDGIIEPGGTKEYKLHEKISRPERNRHRSKKKVPLHLSSNGNILRKKSRCWPC